MNSNTSSRSNKSNKSSAHTAAAHTALHRFKALSCAWVCATLLWTGSASAQVPTTDGVHIGTQIGQWVRNYQQWQEQFNRWKAGTINKFMDSVGLSGYAANNKAAYQNYIDDFKSDKRCDRMSSSSQATARSICTARRALEAQNLENFLDVMNYTDEMQAKIKAAAKEAAGIDASSKPEEAKQKLQQVQTMQNEMSNTIKTKLGKVETNESQISMLKKQQANLAQIALSGRVKSQAEALVDAGIQAATLKAAFTK